MSKTTMRVVKKLVGKKSLSQALSLTAALAASTVFGASGTWVVREGVGTGGTNWATWEDTANWEGDVLPSGRDSTTSKATLQRAYIHSTDGITLPRISGSDYPVLKSDATVDFTFNNSGGLSAMWMQN